jgi:hypothetical protein
MMMPSPLVSEQEDEARILLLQCVCFVFSLPFILSLFIWSWRVHYLLFRKMLFSMEFKQMISSPLCTVKSILNVSSTIIYLFIFYFF